MSRKSCANWKALKRSGKYNIAVHAWQSPKPTNPSLPERAITYGKYLLLGYLRGRERIPFTMEFKDGKEAGESQN